MINDGDILKRGLFHLISSLETRIHADFRGFFLSTTDYTDYFN